MRTVTRRQFANLLGALGLVTAIAGLAFGLPALDRSLPSEQPVRADQPYLIGGGVTVVRPPGGCASASPTRPAIRSPAPSSRWRPVAASPACRAATPGRAAADGTPSSSAAATSS